MRNLGVPVALVFLVLQVMGNEFHWLLFDRIISSLSIVRICFCTFSLCFSVRYDFTLTCTVYLRVNFMCILVCVNGSPSKWNIHHHCTICRFLYWFMFFFSSAFKCFNFNVFSMLGVLEIVFSSSSSFFFCIDVKYLPTLFRIYARYLHFYICLRGIYDIDQTEMIFWLY